MNPDDLFDEERYRPTPEDALPAADLTELMAQAAGNRAYQLEFYRRLLTEQLGILLEDWLPPLAEGQEYMPLTPLLLQSGELPVFTSRETMFASPQLDPETTPHTFVNGRELFSVMQQPVFINPFSDISLKLAVELLAHLLAGDYPRQRVGGQIAALPQADEIGGLTRVPAEHEAVAGQLAEQLRLLFGQHPRARAGLLLWQVPDEDAAAEPCFIVFVEIEGEGERLMQEIAFVASTHLNAARINLKTVFNPSPDAIHAVAGQLELTPFYQD